jgi:SnoaL-like domain
VRKGIDTLSLVDPSEIESICQLKYAYFRLLDLKRFTELGELLTEDATTAYQSGELRQSGRDAIVAFLQESLGDPDIITMHNGHHPEIELGDDDTASGRWYLEDRVIVPAHDFEIHGTALYEDRYTKVDGSWKISHTGYERIYEEHIRYSSGSVRSIRACGQTTTF